jgi:hypothetical protein
MSLTHGEQQVLAEIESRLRRPRPAPAARFAPFRWRPACGATLLPDRPPVIGIVLPLCWP